MRSPIETMADPLSTYIWDARAKQYRARSGRFVSRKIIRFVLDRALHEESATAEAMARAVRAGTTPLDLWQVDQQELIKRTQLYSAALARGGWQQLTAADLDLIGSRVRFHFDRLDRFVAQIQRSEVDVRTQGFVARAASYAQGGRTTYETLHLDEVRETGAVEERNILDPSLSDEQHCDECPELTALGWVPLGQLPRPGGRQCLGRCHCFVEYRDGTGRIVEAA